MIIRSLRNNNVTIINDFVLYRTLADITFQFFSSKEDRHRIYEAVQKIADKGRLGNITIDSTLRDYRAEIPLRIQSVTSSTPTVREDEEFTLTCRAEGSTKMKFRWYKDDIYINVLKSTRNMTIKVRGDASQLYIGKSSKLDDGIYTCVVLDLGIQQCRSTVVQILAKPELRIDPPSATIYRGESLRIRCLSPSNDQTYGTVGYSWTKNNALFQSDPEIEMWEDLYPDGSILKINNIQKSANYTCKSSNANGQVSKSVYIYVVERGIVELCTNSSSFGISWPSSSPGSPVIADCPKRYEGQSYRTCEKKDSGNPTWLLPDFSHCIADYLVDVNNEFRGLTFGYQKSNGSAVLKLCLDYARERHTKFFPGEGGFLLELLKEIDDYLLEKGSSHEQEYAADVILQVLDIVLKSEYSLNNQQQVKQLQTLVQSAALNREKTTSPFPVPVPSTSLHYHQMSSFRIHKQHIKALPFNSQIYGEHLFSDKLSLRLNATSLLQKYMSTGTIMLTIVSYKNLTNFLPQMYIDRTSYASNVDYTVASRIITSWLFYANRSNEYVQAKPLHLPLDAAHVEIIFQHQNFPNPELIPVCGYDFQSTYEAAWRTNECETISLNINETSCICPVTGTYAVLLTKRSDVKVPKVFIEISNRPTFVIFSCGCCFLQSCIAFGILLPVLYSRKCSVTFLKMQFCTATSTAMAIFTLGLLKLLPENWHGLISSTLAGLLLLGTSTLVAIILIIQSELGTRKSPTSNLTSGMRGAIGLSWFLPILYASATPLIYTIIGQWPTDWWLEIKSLGFILFIIIELLFVILFCLLFFTLFQKLLYLAKHHDKHNASILRRIALMYRTAIILAVKLTTDSIYLVYLNSNAFILNYVFGAFSIILGFSILFCFVIKAEEPINKKTIKHSIEDYCSGSINSPLSFYTNHDIEKDNNDGAPPVTTKLPLTILNVSRCPLDRLPNNVDICESVFHHELDDQSPLDNNFHSFSTSAARCYEFEIKQQKEFQNNFNNSILQKQQTDCFPNEFVGVGSLDILQGVSQDSSIIGIKSRLIETNINCSISKLPSNSTFQSVPLSTTTTTTTSSLSTVTTTSTTNSLECALQQTQSQPPTITITSTEEEEEAIDGMLDRITHDLDYLLNRTIEVPTVRRTTVSTISSTSMPATITGKLIDRTLCSSASNTAAAAAAVTTITTALPSTAPPTITSLPLKTPPPPTLTLPASVNTFSPSSLSVHEVIIEECEE